MRKIILYKELINKPGKKVMFQIKIPSNVNTISGIMLGATLRGNKRIPPVKNRHCGELRLSIPSKRGVFYAQSLKLTGHNHWHYEQPGQLGLIASNNWVHKGTKWEFESIDVPAEQTIIEGFYEDEAPLIGEAYYELKIYLRLE